MPQEPYDFNRIEDIVRAKIKDFRVMLPVVGILAAVLVVIIGFFTSFYTVEARGKAVVKRFGAVVDIKDPGPHFRLPFGIDKVYFVPTERQLTQEFGFRTVSTSAQGENGRTEYAKRPEHLEESLMLTGDLKVIDVEWVVQYRVIDPDKYLHQVRDQDKTVRDISEAVMRQIVGNKFGSDVVTEKRVEVSLQAEEELQKILEEFEMGVEVQRVELQDVNPPESVKPAYNEVNEAEQEKERLINEAEKRRSREIPKAKGEAEQIREEARAYSAKRVNRAHGESERFKAILKQYKKAPLVTRQRFYLETMEKIIPRLGKTYIIDKGQTGPLPLLNLNK